jgi:hypothetical protein
VPTKKDVNEYTIKTTGFSPVAMVFIQKRKTVFQWDFNECQYIDNSEKSRQRTMEWKYT